MASDNTAATRRQLKIKAGVVKRWVNGSDHTIPWLESDKIIVSPALPALYTRFFISLTLLFFRFRNSTRISESPYFIPVVSPLFLVS